MNKILGIDLGTNSIGWALRNPDLKENQIEKFGVLTFNKGVGSGKTGEYSYAAERTKKRSTRRLYQARKYRLWATLEHLITEGFCPLTIEDLNKWRHYSKEEARKNNNAGRVYPVDNAAFDAWIKLDFDNDGKPDYTSPYQLRKELAQMKLDLTQDTFRFKLGRALYHVAQRRGFKSSRKGAEDTKEKETDGNEVMDLQYSEKKKNKVITELFEKYIEAKTIGWLFALLENDKIRIRESIAQYAIRENYKDEIKFIFHETQKLGFEHSLYKKLVETGKNKNDGSIFYKRPLRSQKGLVGKCTLEPNKYRAPISHPSFEIFRAWAFLNNIKYTNDKNAKDVEWEKLPLELKEEIFEDKFFRKSKSYFPFSEIIDFIKKKGHNWELNYNPKTTVTACPVCSRLKDIFGNDYLNIKIKKVKAPNSDKEYYDINDIWHVLFNYEDLEYIAEFAEDKLKLEPERLKQFVIAWNTFPVGYGMLSLNAINKINVFLQKGLIYTEAVLLANIPEVIGKHVWLQNEKLFLNNISKVIDENRVDKNILIIVNYLISKHKNLDENKFGYKDINYKLVESDLKDIQQAIDERIGKLQWNKYNDVARNRISTSVIDCYQAYFTKQGIVRNNGNEGRIVTVASGNKKYYKTESGYYQLPKLIDTLKEFLHDNFEQIDETKFSKIYHPSEINIYPPAKEINGVLRLGSPKTGSFKNPMAMRTLHELRKLVNYLIETKQVDNETRIVVEVARDLNDSNKRWALEAWQRQREAENQAFAETIKEHQNTDYVPSDDDIKKVKLLNEQSAKDEQLLPPVLEEIEDELSEVNNKNRKKRKEKLAKDEAVRYNEYSKKLIEKYRLWKEQNFQCFYTGKFISITELFNDNIIDFEHTILRSKSFDNSLANKTIAFADFNRNIKKTLLPTQLSNYDKEYDYGGMIGKCSAILPRLDSWKEKVERIKQQIDFWKTKSKKATEKSWKDDAIRQRHLWQMELDYWQNKLDRFTITEITSGFKNSQKIDTQLISKYAFHYLKTYFERVDVQKGSTTAEFRKIYQLQLSDEKKDRSKHSHHAKDAAVLTLIPVAAKRDDILEKYYEVKEKNSKATFTVEPYNGFKREFIWSIDDSVLINNISNNQELTPSKRKIRKRGTEVIINGKTRYATGDSIRGQLHQETFYGAIKPAKKGENGNLLKDENGKFIQEEKVKYVVRIPFQYKKDTSTPGFKSMDEIKKQVVDEGLKVQIEKQVQKAGGLKEAFEKGIFLLNKNGEPHGNKIRHIRVWARVSEPLAIKKQTNISDKDYKQHYWAANGENFLCVLYQKTIKDNRTGKEKTDRSLEILSLKDAADLLKTGEIAKADDIVNILYRKNNKGEVLLDSHGNKEKPYVILKPAMKVIFYDGSIDELFKKEDEDEDEKNYEKRISYRMYKIVKFTGGRITFQHHLEARNDKDLELAYPENQFYKIDSKNNEIPYGGRGTSGFTEKISDALLLNKFNNYEPWPKLLYSVDWLNMAIEGKHFEIKSDSEILWKKILQYS